MSELITQTYYRIRFPAKAGTYGEFYSSNNGTSEWSELPKVKAIITRGKPVGYKGRTLLPFEDYEIVEITDKIERTTKVIALSKAKEQE